MKLIDHPNGNYRFLTGIAPYSSGVIAMPNFEIIHARLQGPFPLKIGLEKIIRFLDSLDRPAQALCALELRLPKPLSFEEFAEFNQRYQAQLKHWNLLLDDQNPIARTNVAPTLPSLSEPIVYAFSYTIPFTQEFTRPTFVVAGAGDLVDQADLSPSGIIRPNQNSVIAMREKATAVMQVMEERISGLQMVWDTITCLNVYTNVPLHPILADTICKPIGTAAIHGIHWYFSNPPIRGLAFEMDLRGVRQDLIIAL